MISYVFFVILSMVMKNETDNKFYVTMYAIGW